MTAVVCRKRSFLEDIQSPSPLPITKKLRCFSLPHPVQVSPQQQRPTSPTLLDRLIIAFPDMDRELLEKAVEECGSSDLDSTIKKLHELRLGCQATMSRDVCTASNILPVDGAGWVELLVQEMMKATSIEDARSRATKVLESLEKSISARVRADAAEVFDKEQISMKEKIQGIVKENGILKRAVAIQHERQKDYDGRNQEV
ncbi:uncharacterized protein [Coffea arabica]|uniref:CUE domain-containing protein n=1 Tax=Coffea arabica TaxID=13443 RepID=A0A6P6UHV1_COFAR|nr:uncharacterized protein LOC113711502 [Coffea arabica]